VELEDEKVWIEEGSELYASMIHSLENESNALAVLDSQTPTLLVDSTDLYLLQIFFTHR